MTPEIPNQLTNSEIADRIQSIRGDRSAPPDASIVIPVNAQGDLVNVMHTVSDLVRYDGNRHLEFILVVNNFEVNQTPAEIEEYKILGIRTLAIPCVRQPGEAVGFSARIPGISQAKSEAVILFDADCRILDPTSLIDWYIEQFENGVGAAYSHVAYYDFTPCMSIRMRFRFHHLTRWIKRNILATPTTRGSNYAIRRSVMMDLYDQKMLADEMNVGPTIKASGHRVTYSGLRSHYVLTSGRMFRPGWLRIIPYNWYRFRYNLRTLPVRRNVANHTKRERATR